MTKELRELSTMKRLGWRQPSACWAWSCPTGSWSRCRCSRQGGWQRHETGQGVQLQQCRACRPDGRALCTQWRTPSDASPAISACIARLQAQKSGETLNKLRLILKKDFTLFSAISASIPSTPAATSMARISRHMIAPSTLAMVARFRIQC